MKSPIVTLLLLGLGAGLGSSVFAQGVPPQDNIIDGTRYPDGYMPMPIKNGIYPRVYSPNTEKLGPKEMRVTALGTGMPNVITGAQKASGWYVTDYGGKKSGASQSGDKTSSKSASKDTKATSKKSKKKE